MSNSLETIKSNLEQCLKRCNHDFKVDFGIGNLFVSEKDIHFYIGPLDQLYTNFIFQVKSSKVVQWDPKKSCSLHFESPLAVNKLLSQRYHFNCTYGFNINLSFACRYSIMQKVPTLSNIGILVGSLSSSRCD